MRHLRQVTGSLHEALDASADGQELLAGRIDWQGYVRMLRAHLELHQYVAGYTRRLQAHQPTLSLLDWPECARLQALETDLTALDALPGNNTPASMTTSFAAVSPAFACGLLYVVEGACHGTGQMLRALQANQRFVGWRADAFMTASRAGIASRWSNTVQLLEQHGEKQLDVVAQGAVSGFECYTDSMARV